jgi:two-component system sensor histidine kinase SaeS
MSTNPSAKAPDPLIEDVVVLKETIATLHARIVSLERSLEETQRERVEYLQNVAHQLVSPLNAIKWHIENLTNNRIGSVDRAQKVLRSIYSQSTIAVHLAKNFALMSNLEADHELGALQEPLEPVQLCRLLVNLADDFQPLGWDRGIQITVERNLDSTPDVLAIKPLINQVFSNIIENAIKYSSKNTTIMIDGKPLPKREAILITIANRGIPLPPTNKIPMIFARGFRSDAAKNAYPAGTGFGLYIAKKIIEIHKGEIGARTASDGRTIVEIILYIDKLRGMAQEWPKKQSS